MTKLEELREFQRELDTTDGLVDVKFFPGPSAEATEERIASDALTLLKGTGFGKDISNEIL